MLRVAVLSLGLAACANTVPQDRSTGPDGKIKGAREVALQNGEGRARDVVTYPGGDRIDWKKIVLPAHARGTLAIDMNYRTPRPGLKLTFDVFDQYNRPLPQVATGHGRIKSVAIPDATGTYFVRVYAPRRGDAGAYQLKAGFRADVVEPDATRVMQGVELPPPPKLPDIPDPPATTCTTHDPNNPICATVCAPGAPSTWKACLPPPPPPPPVTPPPPPPKPVSARVLKHQIQADGSIIVTLSVGTEMGIDKSWTGALLKGDSAAKLPNGGLQIIRVDKRNTIARVSVTSTILTANQNVLLVP